MGRHAGYLTAASSLLRNKASDGPHLIFIPEFPFNLENFKNNIKKIFKNYGRCVVAVSEGIQNKQKELFTETIKKSNEYDAHGNIQLSGSGIFEIFLLMK